MGLAVVLSALSAVSAAHDHKPPRVALRSPGDRQVGQPWSYGWTTGDGVQCQNLITDGIPNYTRPAMRWRPQRRIHLRMFKRHQPTRLVIRMHLRVNEFGLPAGRGRKADYRLRKARIAGRRTWIAGFYGRRKARRHLYLAVDVFYRDVEGCGGPQHMALAFHLRRRPP